MSNDDLVQGGQGRSSESQTHSTMMLGLCLLGSVVVIVLSWFAR